MFGKIALAAAVAAMLAFSTAPSEAQRGGQGSGFRGGGVHVGGGFRGGNIGGGYRGGHIGGARIGGFTGQRFGVRHGGFVGPRFGGVRHIGVGRPFVRRGVFPHRRVFVGRRFIRPVFVGAGIYGASCWRWRWTPFGWRRVWVCGYP